MKGSESVDFEREMLERLLFVAQQTIHEVGACHDAGHVEDLETVLQAKLTSRGINSLSDEWIRGVAANIAAGRAVRLPDVGDL